MIYLSYVWLEIDEMLWRDLSTRWRVKSVGVRTPALCVRAWTCLSLLRYMYDYAS
jgi:hypothetical protein